MSSLPQSASTLLPHHHDLIRESAITLDVAAQRGYRSVADARELRALGFADYQCQVPALLVPIKDASGRNGLYQLRPDDPRQRKGKAIKYEMPTGARLVLDVPDAVRPQLADPSKPLWITEGARKVDSAISHGLLCIGLLGVDGWRGKNAYGGKTALPCWESIALNGRNVLIAFDSDVMTKPSVRKAIIRLANFLASRGARVQFVILPDGAKTGLDDFFAAGGTVADLDGLTVDELPQPNATTPFPLDVLPSRLRKYVDAGARSLTVPHEMIAMPMIALAGGLIGNRLHVILKSSWREYPTLFVPVAAGPGTGKSPALNLAKWPIDALQKRARDAAKKAHQVALNEWESQPAADRGPKPTMPAMREFFSTDPTMEALVTMLEGAPGVSIIRDEIGGLMAGMDQYRGGKGSDRQQYLSLWAAQAIKVDRKTAPPIYITHPVCSVVGGIQPDLAGQLHHAGNKRDGFVERFLPMVPDVDIARWTDAAPTNEQYCNVLALFDELDMVPAKLIAAANSSDTPAPGAGFGIPLSEEAQAAFVQWFDDNADLISEAHGLLQGFYSKLPAHVARFALILHALSHSHDPRPMVDAKTMEDAIVLAEFCREHIGRFLALLHTAAPTVSGGLHARIMRIMRNANDAKPDSWVSYSTIYRGLRNVKPDDLKAALRSLIDAKQIEHQTSATSTKSADEYRVSHHSHHSHYSHYSQPTVEPDPVTAEKMAALDEADWHVLQAEIAAASSDDPNFAHDRASLELAAQMRSDRQLS